MEVQDRASSATHLVDIILEQIDDGHTEVATIAADVASLFAGELNPVAPKAQRKVQIPEGYGFKCYYIWGYLIIQNVMF